MEQVSTVADLGDVVRAARRAHGWSQQHAADVAGVSRRFVSMLENRHANAEVGRVLALLYALGVRLDASMPGAQPDKSPAAADSPAGGGGEDDIDLDGYLATFTGPHPEDKP